MNDTRPGQLDAKHTRYDVRSQRWTFLDTPSVQHTRWPRHFLATATPPKHWSNTAGAYLPACQRASPATGVLSASMRARANVNSRQAEQYNNTSAAVAHAILTARTPSTTAHLLVRNCGALPCWVSMGTPGIARDTAISRNALHGASKRHSKIQSGF